jgi:hypothetical protein
MVVVDMKWPLNCQGSVLKVPVLVLVLLLLP